MQYTSDICLATYNYSEQSVTASTRSLTQTQHFPASLHHDFGLVVCYRSTSKLCFLVLPVTTETHWPPLRILLHLRCIWSLVTSHCLAKRHQPFSSADATVHVVCRSAAARCGTAGVLRSCSPAGGSAAALPTLPILCTNPQSGRAGRQSLHPAEKLADECHAGV